MFKRISLLLVFAMAILVIAPVAAQQSTSMIDCAGSDGTSISILGPWSGQEEESFKSILAPLIEAFAKGQLTGAKHPKPILVPHENVAMAMAMGYYLKSGKPQAVMVHVNVGTANSLAGPWRQPGCGSE